MLQSEYDLRVRRQESFILAQDGQFLGTLSSNIYQSDSIMNEYGIYGSKYSATSIFNQYGRYGSPYGSYSAFNPYTRTPPQIILRGQLFGVLSMNTHLRNSLNPYLLFDFIRDNRL